MTLDTQVQALTDATTNLLSAVTAQKSTLDNAVAAAIAQVPLATAQAQAAQNNATNAATANTTAQQALAGTTSAAAQAANARDQALTAWRAAAAPGEQLAVTSQSIHSGAVVKAFLYDTSRDSDGGAWRKKCLHTSWYNESINGAWLGQAKDELTARGDNLLSYTEQIDNPIWTKNNGVTVQANLLTAPDGSFTMDKIVEGPGNTTHQLFQGVNMTAGQVVCLTFRAKAAERSKIIVFAGWDIAAVFDLTAGTVAGGQWISKSIKHLGNGIYECQVVGMVPSTVAYSFGIRLHNGVSDTYQGDGASGVYAGCAKLAIVTGASAAGSPDMLQNGSFDSAAGWTTANASISGGKLTLDGTLINAGTNMASSANFQLTPGKVYAVTYTVTGGPGAECAMHFGNNGSEFGGQIITAAGTYTDVFYAAAAPTTLFFRARISNSVRTGSVDNITVKEVTSYGTPYVPCSQLAGSYYQNTTDSKFYALGAAYGQVEVFRGNAREFPAAALIVADASRAIIYDATQPGCPMWMVFATPAGGNLMRGGLNCLAAMNGTLWFGFASPSSMTMANFPADSGYLIYSSTQYTGPFLGNLAQRSAAPGFGNFGKKYSPIIINQVNDIALTVLPDAPIDPDNGLPTPTVAVGTSGGVSVLKHDGTVTNSSFTSSVDKLVINKQNDLLCMRGADARYFYVRANTYLVNNFPLLNYSGGGIPSMLAANGMPRIAENGASANASGLLLLKENPAVTAKSMIAAITNAYSSGWQVGDSRSAWLADVVTETVTGGELIANGSFADTSAWVSNAAIANGNATLAANTSVRQAIVTVPGATYQVSVDVLTASDRLVLRAGTSVGSPFDIYSSPAYITTTGTKTFTFQAKTNSTQIQAFNDLTATTAAVIDNFSVRIVDADRSVKNKGLIVNGSVTKAPVAAGAQLVGYSGFSPANYLEQPYNSDLDFGTGDFCVMGWMKVLAGTNSYLFDHASPVGAARIYCYVTQNSGTVNAGILGSNASATVSAAGVLSDTNGYHQIAFVRTGGNVLLYLDGARVATNSDFATNLQADTAATFTAGMRYNKVEPAAAVALMRVSASAASADQIAQIYRDELALFQPGAQCTIDGTSTAVTALAYDDSTDVLHVGTSWGRSSFKGLRRVESVVTSVGAITSLAAGFGAHMTAGASSGRYFQSAMSLRDELRRREEARRAMALEIVPFDFDGIAAQTLFTLPIGFKTKGVFVAGTKKRSGATKDYTTTFDGYRETVNFGVSPGLTWVQITANRSF